MKIFIFSKTDVITHPLTLSLIRNWGLNGSVEYYTIHSEVQIKNCTIKSLASKKYLDHLRMKRYFLTIVFYLKMLYKLSVLRKSIVYFPFNVGPINDRFIKFIKGSNLFVFHCFEYDKSNLRASKFADIVIHPERTRLKLTSFKIPNKKHFYFPNVLSQVLDGGNYKYEEDINKFAKNRIKLFYQGLINVEKRCLREILEALKIIHVDYCLIIMPGNFTRSSELNKVNNIIEELGLENSILFVPTMKAPDHLNIVSHIDIGIGLYKPLNINQYFAAPNRIFELNHFRKPLILPDFVGLKRYELEFKGEIFCCNPDSKSSIVDAITRASNFKSNTKKITDEIGDFSIYFNELNDLIKNNIIIE